MPSDDVDFNLGPGGGGGEGGGGDEGGSANGKWDEAVQLLVMHQGNFR